jgi:phosphoglycolate phosphatase (TIGR01487 family)
MDIDGTMTSKDRKIDIAAINAVRKAEASGLPVALATGNLLAFAEGVATMLGTSGPLIAEDGGVVLDTRSGREYILGDRVEADRGFEALRKKFDKIEQTRNSHLRLTGLTIKRTITAEQAMEVFRSEGLDLVAVDSGFAIHIRSPAVNKGTALRKVASLLGITTADIAAMGDGTNDIEMLQAAGLSFAPADAHEAAKRASTYVTSSPDGRGVAEAIDKMLSLIGR